MKHTIDLSKYRIRTDLAIDYLEDENIKNEIIDYDGIKVTKIYLEDKIANKLNKKKRKI